MMNTIVALLLYGVIIFLLQLLITDQPNAIFVLRCLGYIAASWLTTGILYAPKVIMLLSHGVAAADALANNKTYQGDSEDDTGKDSPMPERTKSGGAAGKVAGGSHGSGTGTTEFKGRGVQMTNLADLDNRSRSEERRLAEATRNAQTTVARQPMTPIGRKQMSMRKAGMAATTAAADGTVLTVHQGSGVDISRDDTVTDAMVQSPVQTLSDVLTTFFEAHPQLLDLATTAVGLGSTADTIMPSTPSGANEGFTGGFTGSSLTRAQTRLVSLLALRLTSGGPATGNGSAPNTDRDRPYTPVPDLPGQIGRSNANENTDA